MDTLEERGAEEWPVPPKALQGGQGKSKKQGQTTKEVEYQGGGGRVRLGLDWISRDEVAAKIAGRWHHRAQRRLRSRRCNVLKSKVGGDPPRFYFGAHFLLVAFPLAARRPHVCSRNTNTITHLPRRPSLGSARFHPFGNVAIWNSAGALAYNMARRRAHHRRSPAPSVSFFFSFFFVYYLCSSANRVRLTFPRQPLTFAFPRVDIILSRPGPGNLFLFSLDLEKIGWWIFTSKGVADLATELSEEKVGSWGWRRTREKKESKYTARDFATCISLSRNWVE